MQKQLIFAEIRTIYNGGKAYMRINGINGIFRMYDSDSEEQVANKTRICEISLLFNIIIEHITNEQLCNKYLRRFWRCIS